MDANVAKRLFAAFDLRMRDTLPAFVRSANAAKALREFREYHWEIAKVATSFLLVVVSPNSDAFTIEGAWSKNGKFPFQLNPMSPLGNQNADIPPADPIDGEFRFRIPELWDVGSDTWWHVRGDHDMRDVDLDTFLNTDWSNTDVPDYSDAQIEQVVGEAIRRINTHAIPFMCEGMSKTFGTPVMLP